MITLYPGCKINLGLKVLNKREDGYHNLDSIFLPLAWPADVLKIRPAKSGFHLQCDKPLDSANILEKTWKIFAQATSFAPALSLSLVKNIPVGAGLGGGSSDAATFLKWLAQQTPAPMSKPGLLDLAAKIGADVPFFLMNKLARISGAGEIVRPVKNMKLECWIVLIWPQIYCSTAEIFQAFDRDATVMQEKNLTKPSQPDTDFVPDQNGLPECLNDLEQPVFVRYPELANIKAKFLQLGAIRSAMSGSGSTIYGIFLEQETAKKAVQAFCQKYRHIYLVHFKN